MDKIDSLLLCCNSNMNKCDKNKFNILYYFKINGTTNKK